MEAAEASFEVSLSRLASSFSCTCTRKQLDFKQMHGMQQTSWGTQSIHAWYAKDELGCTILTLARTRTRTPACTHKHTHPRMRASAHTYTNTHTSARAHARARTHTYTQTYTHTLNMCARTRCTLHAALLTFLHQQDKEGAVRLAQRINMVFSATTDSRSLKTALDPTAKRQTRLGRWMQRWLPLIARALVHCVVLIRGAD